MSFITGLFDIKNKPKVRVQALQDIRRKGRSRSNYKIQPINTTLQDT